MSDSHENLEGLSVGSKDIITSYLVFAKHQVELQTKEIDTAFTNVAESRYVV